jgi:hypothetical protein
VLNKVAEIQIESDIRPDFASRYNQIAANDTAREKS